MKKSFKIWNFILVATGSFYIFQSALVNYKVMTSEYDPTYLLVSGFMMLWISTLEP